MKLNVDVTMRVTITIDDNKVDEMLKDYQEIEVHSAPLEVMCCAIARNVARGRIYTEGVGDVGDDYLASTRLIKSEVIV